MWDINNTEDLKQLLVGSEWFITILGCQVSGYWCHILQDNGLFKVDLGGFLSSAHGAPPSFQYTCTYFIITCSQNSIYSIKNQNATTNIHMCCFHISKIQFLMFSLHCYVIKMVTKLTRQFIDYITIVFCNFCSKRCMSLLLLQFCGY